MSEHRATVEWQRSGEFRCEPVTFSGKSPSEQEHRALHEKAHEKCFIANSVKTEVVVEPC